ncbi:MAG TPA: hypothetical protein VM684_04470 [Gaiellales bacterium]|nr:hypothetical protein [Gaiellales bacterium]HVI35459.1 hypothetical protein [Gaiellales bacterium]
MLVYTGNRTPVGAVPLAGVKVDDGLALPLGPEPDVDPPPLDDELHPDSTTPTTTAAAHSRDLEPVLPMPPKLECA